MGVYQTVCYMVEDLFVKMLTKKTDIKIANEKVRKYRHEKEQHSQQRKTGMTKDLAEQSKIEMKESKEHANQPKEQDDRKEREMEALLSKVMGKALDNSQYEYNEIKRNKELFQNLVQTVFEPNETALTFIFCKYDQSRQRKMKGYLIPTNKKIVFIRENSPFTESFSYQTINHVNWFQNGYLDGGLEIQCLSRKLEFGEIADTKQLKKMRNIILKRASKKAI